MVSPRGSGRRSRGRGGRLKIKFNQRAFEEIRRPPKVAAEVDRVARSLASSAGPGYAWSGRQGAKGVRPAWTPAGPYQPAPMSGRYRAIVYPETWAAYRDNARNNTLAKLAGGSW